MSAATARVPARGWILADFDDTLAPDDSHAGLLRFILRRRIWPLLLWPLMAFGAVISSAARSAQSRHCTHLVGHHPRAIPWPGAPWYGSTA